MTPAYVNAGSRTNSTGATSRTPALPASRVNGNWIIAFCMSKNNATHSCSSSGWTQLGTQVNSGANFTVSLWKRIVDGTEGAPTISWSGSVECMAGTLQYSGASSSPIGASLSNTGSTSTHSNSGITTTGDNSLVIYIDIANANTALATPSGWTERVDIGGSSPAVRGTIGDKAVSTSGSASGAISVTGANDVWVMWQIELKNAALTGTLTQPSEADSAQALTHAKQKTVELNAETDTAQALTHTKQKTVELNAETDSAQALTRAKRKPVGQVTEEDTAQAVIEGSSSEIVQAVSQNAEADLAQALTRAKRKTLGQAVETDKALGILVVRIRSYTAPGRKTSFEAGSRDLLYKARERKTIFRSAAT